MSIILNSVTPSGQVKFKSNTPTPVISGLQVWYDAGNPTSYPGSGSTLYDLSGNSRNGSLFLGTGTINYTANNGGGLITASGATIGASYNLPSGAWTVEVVCSLTITQYWAGFWGNEVWNAGSGYLSYFDSGTQLRTSLPSYAGQKTVDAGNISTINHWVWVNDTTSYLVYKNSTELVGSGSYVAQPNLCTIGTVFGGRHANGATSNDQVADTLNGVFYIIRMYNSALDSSQITQNFNTIKARFGL